MATKTTINLHGDLMSVARLEVPEHIEEDDGEKCFNRYGYLLRLDGLVSDLLCDRNSPAGDFDLKSHHVARYLYCCLCLEQGDTPDGDTFQGMPILD